MYIISIICLNKYKTTIIQINGKQHSLTKWGTNHNKLNTKPYQKDPMIKEEILT